MRFHKYKAKPTVVDGIRFASKKEAARYEQLRLLERSKEILNLELQPRFPLAVNGIKICEYRADFRYWDKRKGSTVIEDVKGVRTPIYSLKKKLLRALTGKEILET